jgi:putative lipoic acid-binding regulatory protein
LTETDRQRAIDLLHANHAFPGDYRFSVIALNDPAVTAAVLAAAGAGRAAPIPPEADEVRSSSGGKYLSHRLTLQVENGEEVLDLYARLRAVEGVITIF